MVKGNKLCLVFVKYVISFENIRRFMLVPSPPMKMISFFGLFINYLRISKHRNDVPYSVNIINLNVATTL